MIWMQLGLLVIIVFLALGLQDAIDRKQEGFQQVMWVLIFICTCYLIKLIFFV
jgi:Na+/glutamate symporter